MPPPKSCQGKCRTEPAPLKAPEDPSGGAKLPRGCSWLQGSHRTTRVRPPPNSLADSGQGTPVGRTVGKTEAGPEPWPGSCVHTRSLRAHFPTAASPRGQGPVCTQPQVLPGQPLLVPLTTGCGHHLPAFPHYTCA